MIIGHTNKGYQRIWSLLPDEDRWNGAYYYSQEIVQNIIPNVETDRNWVTVDVPFCEDHSIVFIHSNIRTEVYEHLKDYKDLILVCGVSETCEKVAHLGKAIYLPLSVDVEYVKSFKVKKEERTKGAAYAGRKSKMTAKLPDGIDYLTGMPRFDILQEMARYKTIYAVGRLAIEAKILGCKIGAYDDRFPKVSFWKVLDNLDAAKILQEKIDEIDKPKGDKPQG